MNLFKSLIEYWASITVYESKKLSFEEMDGKKLILKNTT